MLIKGGSQRAGSTEGLTVPEGMESKDVYADAMENGEGKQFRKIIPVADF